MKNITKLVLVILAVSLLSSCGKNKEKLSESIKTSEEKLGSTALPDTNTIKNLIADYQNYANKFPDDTLSPEYLYRAASWKVGIGESKEAVKIYEKIIDTYPDWRKLPETVFVLGFTYENALNDYANANKIYNSFLLKFPEHYLTKDVENLIKYLGKPTEEMISDFESLKNDSINKN